MLFLDASALVKRYVHEAGSRQVNELLTEAVLVVSRLTQVEVMSAISRRVREGSLLSEDRSDIEHQLHQDLKSVELVEITQQIAAVAETLLGRHELRAGDAIQLASCLQVAERTGQTIRFLAFDERLNRAASSEGFSCWPFSS